MTDNNNIKSLSSSYSPNIIEECKRAHNDIITMVDTKQIDVKSGQLAMNYLDKHPWSAKSVVYFLKQHQKLPLKSLVDTEDTIKALELIRNCELPKLQIHTALSFVSLNHSLVPTILDMHQRNELTSFLNVWYNSVDMLHTTSQPHHRRPSTISYIGNEIGTTIKRYHELDTETEANQYIIVFINTKSGGKKGEKMLKKFEKLNFEGVMIVDLLKFGNKNKESQRELFTQEVLMKKSRIVVAGGDGTTLWLLNLWQQCMDTQDRIQPVAFLPLGTGNELSCVTGWGKHMEWSKKLDKYIQIVRNSFSVIELDLWNITIHNLEDENAKKTKVSPSTPHELTIMRSHYWKFPTEEESDDSNENNQSKEKTTEKQVPKSDSNVQWETPTDDEQEVSDYSDENADDDKKVDDVAVVNPNRANKNVSELSSNMSCFFSIGFDAYIALNFHRIRESNPEASSSVFKNKLWHAWYGAKELLTVRDSISDCVELYVDGKKCELPKNCRSLQFFNIHSSADGINFWGTGKSKKNELQDYTHPYLNDGKLECVATKGVAHLMKVALHFKHSKRVAQGSDIRLKITHQLPAQLDGEPWLQSPCTIQISHTGTTLPILQGYKPVLNVGK